MLVDGYSQDQRFFMNWVTVWRRNLTDASCAYAPEHRSARTGQLPCQWCAVEHAVVRRCVPVARRRCDGVLTTSGL